MESITAGLAKDVEDGKLNRRQLLQTLAVAVAGASFPRGAAAQGASRFRATLVDHISYEVADYKRSRDWYVDVLGMTVQADNGKTNAYLRFGNTVLIVRNPRGPQSKPPTVDHIAYRIENWNTDKVKAELERRGLKGDRGGTVPPRLDVPAAPTNPNYISFHIFDPDGLDVEIAGIAQPGDSQYKPAPALSLPASSGKGLKAIFVNHISYSVNDYKVAHNFYSNLLGMSVTNDDGKQAYLRFGDSVVMVRHGSPAHPDAPSGTIDHMAYHIENWNTERVLAELKSRGLKNPRGEALRAGTPADGPQPNYVNCHVADPDGYDVEICGVAQPGDPLYKKLSA